MRELHPEDEAKVAWLDGKANGELLAHLIDEVRSLEWLYTSAHNKSKRQRPEPFPTPWNEDTRRSKTQHFGKGAISISEWDEWWASKTSKEV